MNDNIGIEEEKLSRKRKISLLSIIGFVVLAFPLVLIPLTSLLFQEYIDPFKGS